MSVPPRRHRLPQRLDWKLIPPPLDLSKPLVDDSASLPAIIVTPSSPKGSRDFQIAFLAPPKEETICERVFSRINKNSASNSDALIPQFRPRTLFLLFIPIFLLFCHVLVHRLGTFYPHLRFDVHTKGGAAHVADGGAEGTGWVDFNDYREVRNARRFVIDEEPL